MNILHTRQMGFYTTNRRQEINDLLSNTMGCSQDVSVGNQCSSAELLIIFTVQYGCHPRPFIFVCFLTTDYFPIEFEQISASCAHQCTSYYWSSITAQVSIQKMAMPTYSILQNFYKKSDFFEVTRKKINREFTWSIGVSRWTPWTT
jgi:hypothetical protein